MNEPKESPTHVVAYNSIVQIAGAHSNQSAQLSIDQSKVTEIINQIENELPSLKLPDAERKTASTLLADLRKMISEKLSASAVQVVAQALVALITDGGSSLGSILLDALNIGR